MGLNANECVSSDEKLFDMKPVEEVTPQSGRVWIGARGRWMATRCAALRTTEAAEEAHTHTLVFVGRSGLVPHQTP